MAQNHNFDLDHLQFLLTDIEHTAAGMESKSINETVAAKRLARHVADIRALVGTGPMVRTGIQQFDPHSAEAELALKVKRTVSANGAN